MDTPSEPIFLVKIHPKVSKQDLPELPQELKDDFEDLKLVLSYDPYSCDGIDSHDLERELSGCRAIEIDYYREAYRLVYRIFDSPKTMRVEIISFSYHDPAYDKAKERILNYKKNYRYYDR